MCGGDVYIQTDYFRIFFTSAPPGKPLFSMHRGKEPGCQCRRHKRHRFDPWVRKIPRRRMWEHTPVFLPGESHDREAWWDSSSIGLHRVGHD